MLRSTATNSSSYTAARMSARRSTYSPVPAARLPTLSLLPEGFTPQELKKIAASLSAKDNSDNNSKEDSDADSKEDSDTDSEEDSDANSNKDSDKDSDNNGDKEKNVSRRPKGSKAVLRRLVARSAYYTTASNAAWTATKRKRQMLLSYVGRIEETNASIDRTPRCGPCIKKGLVCRIYTRAASKQYIARKIASNNYTYTRCRFYSSQIQCLQSKYYLFSSLIA